MSKIVSKEPGLQERRTSIKRIIVVFSVLLFSLILIGGSTVFLISMRQSITGKVAQQAAEVNTASANITAHLESAKELGFTG